MAELVATLRDRSGEKSTVTFQIADQGAGVTIADINAFGSSLETIIEDISLLTLVNIYFRQGLLTEDTSVPASEWANRENAMRVFYQTAGGAKGRLSVPGPDLANCARDALSDNFTLTDTEVDALVTFVETYVKIGGSAVTVEKAVYVGRDN